MRRGQESEPQNFNKKMSNRLLEVKVSSDRGHFVEEPIKQSPEIITNPKTEFIVQPKVIAF